MGAVQGFISSALLFFNKKNLSHSLLACLILILSLACLNLYLLEIGLPHESAFWNKFSLVVPLVIVMPIGPLILFYVRSLIRPKSNLEKQDWIHFYPILLDFTPRIAAALYVIGLEAHWITEEEGMAWLLFINGCDMFLDIPRWLSVSIYTFVAWKNLKASSSIKTEEKGTAWARQFVYAFAIFQFIWLLHLVPYITPSLSDGLMRAVSWYPIYIPLAIMVYWLGINGYLIRSNSRREFSKNVSIPVSLIDKTREALLQSMEIDHLYLDPTLSLNLMVERIGIPQKTISHVLNQHIGKSFNDFVNEYRIEAVKRKLLEGHRHLTITGIALECGFNSQATFQRAFKNATGQSPTEYLSQTDKKILDTNAQI